MVTDGKVYKLPLNLIDTIQRHYKTMEPATIYPYHMYLEARKTVKKYDDASMLWHIKKEENIPILEEILAKEREYYFNNLKKQKLNFGKRVSKRHLEETLEEVKTQVDEFLDIRPGQVGTCEVSYPGLFDENYFYMMKKLKRRFPIKKDLKLSAITAAIAAAGATALSICQGTITPGQLMFCTGIASMPLIVRTIRNNWLAYNHRHAGCYWYDKKEIATTRTARESLVPVLAHEYTHHATYSLVKRGEYLFNAFDEGLAMGTEDHIAKIYSEKEGNKTFEHYTFLINLEELAMVYKWLCQKLGKNINEKIVKKTNINELDQYRIGNAYFTIESAKKGKTVYKDALHELAKASHLLHPRKEAP